MFSFFQMRTSFRSALVIEGLLKISASNAGKSAVTAACIAGVMLSFRGRPEGFLSVSVPCGVGGMINIVARTRNEFGFFNSSQGN